MKPKGILGKLKKTVYWIDDEFPLIGHPLVKGLRFIRYHLVYGVFYYFRGILGLRGRDINKINKIYWIDPQKIEYYGNRCFDPFKERGKVLDGDWDLKLEKFNDLKIYKAFEERFKSNKPWQETDFYSYILERINKGEILWRCKNKELFEKRLKKLDNLYYRIKNEGYKLNREIKSKDKLDDDPRREIDEVTVNIDRDGHYLFNDGAHRLSIAKLLRISQIPVIVVARHKKWVDFKKKLIFHANQQRGKLYQSAIHPDLQDIPFVYGNLRFDLIKKNLSIFKGKVLDIGANLGYFCHKFEDLGFDCYAVEINPQELYFLDKLKKAGNKKFKIISESIFEYKRTQELKFDVILALNIFHHFLKRKSTYEDLINFLKRIQTKELFFEAHKFEEKQMKGAYRNYRPKDFANFILKHSSLNKIKFIGITEGGRRLYKLYKEK